MCLLVERWVVMMRLHTHTHTGKTHTRVKCNAKHTQCNDSCECRYAQGTRWLCILSFFKLLYMCKNAAYIHKASHSHLTHFQLRTKLYCKNVKHFQELARIQTNTRTHIKVAQTPFYIYEYIYIKIIIIKRVSTI